MDDQPPSTRRSGRARRGREVFSPDLGGGTGSTRWSPEVMRRTGSGSGASASLERVAGVMGGKSRESGGSRSQEKEKRRDRDKYTEKGKEKAIDVPPVRVQPTDVPPVQIPALQTPTMQQERSPSFELIEPTPPRTTSNPTQTTKSTSTSHPSRQPPPADLGASQQPSAPYSRAIPPKVKLKTALQPVIHDLSQKKRSQATSAVAASSNAARFTARIGEPTIAATASSSKRTTTPSAASTSISTLAPRSTSSAIPAPMAVPETTRAVTPKEVVPTVAAGLRESMMETSTVRVASTLLEPAPTAPAEQARLDPPVESFEQEMDIEPVAASPLIPDQATARLSTPPSSAPPTPSVLPTSSATPRPTVSAASAAAAAVIAAWNARFSPQVDDRLFDPNWRITPPDHPSAEPIQSPYRPAPMVPVPPTMHTNTIQVSPVASPPPPLPTPAAPHPRVAPIGPKKRLSSAMKPVIYDLSSKSRSRHGIPEKAGDGDGSTTVSKRAQAGREGDGVERSGGDVHLMTSRDGGAATNGSARNKRVSNAADVGEQGDRRHPTLANDTVPLVMRKEPLARASTSSNSVREKRDPVDQQESRRKESRRVRVRSPSPPRRRKETDRQVGDTAPSISEDARQSPPARQGSRRTEARVSGESPRRRRNVDPYAEEFRVDSPSDEDYAPPLTRKESRERTARDVESESPVRRTRDVGRAVVERGVPSAYRTSSSRNETHRAPGRVPEVARRRKEGQDLGQDMEESRVPSSPEQHHRAPSTEKATRGREARVEESAKRRRGVDEAFDETRISDQDEPPRRIQASRVNQKRPEEPSRPRKDGTRASEGDRQSPATSSRTEILSALEPPLAPAPSASRSKESRRPAAVPRSRAMRLQAEQETSSRRSSSKEIRYEDAPTILEDEDRSPRRSGRGIAIATSPLRTQEQHTDLSSPERPSVSRLAAQSPVTQEQLPPLPPPPPIRTVNANFQDYLRRSQTGRKGGGPPRPPTAVEKRKRVDETLADETLREAPVPKDRGTARKVPEPLTNWTVEIETEPELPSPRLPTPPALSQPLPPPPPLTKEKTRSTSARTSASVSTQSRQPSTKALLLAEKQAQIARLIDEHDTVLREMFHLEKFKTMVVGYDPRVAKQETSNVWKEWQAPFDLINKFITSQTEAFEVDQDLRASSRRTTRRKMEEQVNTLPLEVLLGIPSSLRIVKEEIGGEDVEMEQVEEKRSTREVRGGGGKSRVEERMEVIEELPPPPRAKTREPSKRKPTPITVESATPTPTTASFTISPVQPRPSKKRRIATPSDVADEFQMNLDVSHRPTVDRPASLVEKGRTTRSKPPPVQVYNLPPAPPPRYTCPEQFPAHRPPAVPAAHVIFASPKLTAFPASRDAASVFPTEVLTSFVMLEADGDLLTKEDLRRMAEAQVEVVRSVIELQVRGRRILPGHTEDGNGPAPRHHAPRTRHDATVEHALRFRTYMLREQKYRISQKKKIVKAVDGYWSGIASVEERRRKEEERRIRTGAREIAKLIKSKWKLAIKVIRMRKQAEAKAEQERLGREHLKKILERSENMLKNRKREIAKPRREGSQMSTAFPPEQPLPEPTIYELYAGEIADTEVAHDTDDEAPAEMDVEEEEAAKTYEESRAADGRSLSAVALTVQERDDKFPDDGIFIVEVPELTEAEKRTYSRVDLAEQLGLLDGDLSAPAQSQDSDSLAVSLSVSSREALHRLDPIPEDTEVESDLGKQVANPDAHAIDSNFSITADLEDEDRRYDEEMLAEDAQIADSDDEDEGLLRDAELPIEELLARYGYKVDGTSGAPMESDDSITHPVNDATGSDDSADSDDGNDRENIDESVAAASEPSDESETDSVTDIEQSAALPFLLRANLRPYQKDGLTWLARLYREKTNAILADEMGLGKTLQTIALLAHLACDHQEWGPHLIIVPTSVILNWEMEFKKFLPGFKVLTYYGNQQERKDKRKGWFAPHAFQVCITSYQIAIADQAMLRRRHWQYLILDEAHNIKNFKSQRWQTLLGFKSERRLLLTGTPLQNNLMELWSLMYFLMPSGLSDDLSYGGEFANHQEFSEWFSNPMDKAIESGDGISPEARETVNRLHVILRPFILRRLKAEVEKQLPAKFEHTLYCNLSKRQQYLYDEFMSRSSTRQSLVSGGYLGIANCLMQLRKVCNHPDLFEVRPIATSFAMKQSVVTPFLGSFAAFEGAAQEKLAKSQLYTLVTNQGHGISTSIAAEAAARLDATELLPLEQKHKGTANMPPKDTRTVEGWKRYRAYELDLAKRQRWTRLRETNRVRCSFRPLICFDMLQSVRVPKEYPESKFFGDILLSNTKRMECAWPVIQQYAVIPPRVTALEPSLVFSRHSQHLLQTESFHRAASILHPAAVKLQIAFPDKTLLQYDCGKLQMLAGMLKKLQAGGHRVLIFTQMTKMLDILELFLSHAGYRYSRLDGSTKVEDRLLVTERFNNNPRIFAFIASTRSGGVGINLTGADTVIFYDNEFNPAMDKQAMDRAHRIGQTREVNIYRLVTRHTVEENMLKKANQKRMLDDVVMQEGNFTTDYLSNNASKGRSDLRDLLGEDAYDSLEMDRLQQKSEGSEIRSRATSVAMVDEREMEHALEQVQDTEDIEAGREAAKEIELDDTDFNVEFDKNVADPDGQNSTQGTPKKSRSASATARGFVNGSIVAGRPTGEVAVGNDEYDGGMEGMQQDTGSEDDEMEDDAGAIDDYMLRLVEWDWSYFV